MAFSSSIGAHWLCLAVLLASARGGFAQPHAASRRPAAEARASSHAALAGEDAQRFQAALADYNAGNLTRAQPVLTDLARRYPREPEVQAAAGMTLAEQGDVAGALPLLQRAHQLAPGNGEIASNLAVAYVKTGHALEAVPLLHTAVQQQKTNAELRITLAQAEMQAGQASAASESFAQADALLRAQGKSADADLRHDWALALLGANRAPQAVAVLQASPDLESTPALQELLAEAEEKSGHFEAAVQHFKRAAELEPSEAHLYAYGNELMQHWTFPAAIEIFRFAAERYPQNERLQMGLGIAYFGNGTYDKAVPVFEAMLARDPNSQAAADLLGRSCSALAGAQQPGCTQLRSFAQAHPENAPASLYAAIAMLHQPADKQDTAAAEALLRNALRVDPKMADAWYQLAAVQQSQNQWESSAASLQRALAARPAYAEAHYRLARAYSHLGRRDEAQQQIALQQQSAADAKAAENKRMQEVMTFLTTSH